MTQDILSYQDIASDIASFAGEAGSDVQKNIILPAMMDVIGSVRGKDVLELYCGAGYFARRMASLGANVTAVDTSERLIEIAREIDVRESKKINFAVSDTTDLSVVEDSTFDDIICNMGLMMTRDLSGTIAELARMVKLGGRFIFSVLHPCYCTPDSCWAAEDDRPPYRTIDSYFTESWWSSELVANIRSGRNRVKHRTLSRYINALGARGFTVRRIVEPKPSPETVACYPQLEVYNRIPVALIVEAVFPYL